MIEDHFSLPFVVIDSQTAYDRLLLDDDHPFNLAQIIITTYDFAAKKSEEIAKVEWDFCVFEEAHHLRRIYTAENSLWQAAF